MNLKIKYHLAIILCILSLTLLSPAIIFADKAEDEILGVTEGFFIALKKKDLPMHGICLRTNQRIPSLMRYMGVSIKQRQKSAKR